MHLSAIFLFVLSCIGVTYGYSSLRRQIPNGYKVPHPCTPGTTWDAVGHMKPEYDLAKNAFGKDVREILKDRQLEWAKVCNKDSDGDGLTNGQELGDPSCQWKVSDGLQGLTEPLGHPGICEPGRPQCTSGITFKECPNPLASGSSGPRITVPPHNHSGFPNAMPIAMPMPSPNFGSTDGLQGGFQQPQSVGSFSASQRSPMNNSPSSGSRGSVRSPSDFGAPAFSRQDSFGDQRPRFESQPQITFGGPTGFDGRPEMGGHTSGSPMPGFRGPQGSSTGFGAPGTGFSPFSRQDSFGGPRPSFGIKSHTSFGGSTGFDGRPEMRGQMGGHTFSDHSSVPMYPPWFFR